MDAASESAAELSPLLVDSADAESAPRPYADAHDHLADHLRRTALCLERLLRMARLRRPSFGDDAAPDGKDAARMALLERELEDHDALVESRRQASGPEVLSQLPLERLRAAFELTEPALRILVAAAAPGFDVHLARGFEQALGRDDGQPDVALLVELLARDGIEEKALLAELSPEAPLLRWRLLRLGQARGWTPEGPQLRRPVAVPERVAEFIAGHVGFAPERYDMAAELRDGLTRRAVVSTAIAWIARALGRSRAGRPSPLCITGAELVGKSTAVVAAAASLGWRSLLVNLEQVAALPQPLEAMRDLMREARLSDALLVLRRSDALDEARLRQLVLPALRGDLRVVVTLRGAPPDLLRLVPDLQILPLGMPSREAQHEIWKLAVPPAVAVESPDLLERIVTRYRLNPGDILEAGELAVATARLRGPQDAVTLDDLVSAVRGRLRHRLGDVAELMTTSLEWSDLVVRAEVKERLDELISSVRFQSTVMSDWGFQRKMAYGRAVSALFSGPPGTGKTMVATLLGKELGLELFRVDLSRVVSKWVGETEKNLGRAFDEAQAAQAILLFDEADALFAKRTEVKSSNDRYANLEVNYLLQRLEGFEGVVLLTTNNQSAIDDAFRRRLRFRVDFPTPEEDERELLWKAMLPSGAPVEPDIDFTTLARKYEMTGGYIKNAVIRAAYLAAASPEKRITADSLLLAAQREWEDMGKLTMR